MYTDNLYTFDVLTKPNLATEAHLMIYLKCVQNSNKHMNIDDIAYGKSQHTLSDALTKVNKVYIYSSIRNSKLRSLKWTIDSTCVNDGQQRF